MTIEQLLIHGAPLNHPDNSGTKKQSTCLAFCFWFPCSVQLAVAGWFLALFFLLLLISLKSYCWLQYSIIVVVAIFYTALVNAIVIAAIVIGMIWKTDNDNDNGNNRNLIITVIFANMISIAVITVLIVVTIIIISIINNLANIRSQKLCQYHYYW